MKQSSFTDRLVERLRSLVAHCDTDFLPSMAILAHRFDVSVPSLLKAARILREQGHILFGRGSRIRLVRMGVPKVVPRVRENPAVRVSALLKTRIENGAYRAGQVLPKLATIASDVRCSCSSVTEAVARLGELGVLHKEGRRWVVGPECGERQDKRTVVGHDDAPAIILVLDRTYQWAGMFTSERTRSFVTSFVAEQERYGVKMLTVFAEASTRKPPPGCPVGLDTACAFAKALGHRYLGTLFLCHDTRLVTIPTWVPAMLSFRKPVVWFDRNNQRPADCPSGPLFTRCYYAEEPGVCLALEYLADKGHTSVAVPFSEQEDEGWRHHRFALINRTTGGLATAISVARTRTIGDKTTFPEILADAGKSTAFLTLRDSSAQRLMLLLWAAKVRVPESFSVMSFDNHPWAQEAGITSVDFGFGFLGYAAFHRLFGVIRITRDNHGEIASRPHIVDRGSVGRPRKGKMTNKPDHNRTV